MDKLHQVKLIQKQNEQKAILDALHEQEYIEGEAWRKEIERRERLEQYQREQQFIRQGGW